jgi:hypothetical protein
MANFEHKYHKYKKKYLLGGNSVYHIVIIKSPHFWSLPNIEIDDQVNNIINQIQLAKSKKFIIYQYQFKFDYPNINYKLEDIEFESVATDIKTRYEHLGSFIVITVSHGSPYGLYFVDKYPELCKCIICYPLRLYSDESLERRVWKLKDQGGWSKYVSKKYNIEDYYLNINEIRFQELLNDNTDESREIIFNIFDKYLQLNNKEIIKVFKVPTYLFTRLDMNTDTIIKLNYERKDIADMKGIITKDDALYAAMMWNYARVKYDIELRELNKETNKLTILYIISGIEDGKEVALLLTSVTD